MKRTLEQMLRGAAASVSTEALQELAEVKQDAERYRAIRDALVRQDQRAADVIDNGIDGFKDAEVLTPAMLDEIADRIIVACAE